MIADDALVDPAPGDGPLSTHTTDRPLRLSSRATADPITPAPMTTASVTSHSVELVDHGEQVPDGDVVHGDEVGDLRAFLGALPGTVEEHVARVDELRVGDERREAGEPMVEQQQGRVGGPAIGLAAERVDRRERVRRVLCVLEAVD